MMYASLVEHLLMQVDTLESADLDDVCRAMRVASAHATVDHIDTLEDLASTLLSKCDRILSIELDDGSSPAMNTIVMLRRVIDEHVKVLRSSCQALDFLTSTARAAAARRHEQEKYLQRVVPGD